MTTKQLMKREAFSIKPGNLQEALQLANLIAKSGLAPKGYAGKPDDVLIAIMMGGEIGLAPMQALQNIAVINGRPTIWGDAVTALVYQHPDLEWIKEWFDNPSNPTVAFCTVKRKGNDAHTRQFSLADASRAGLTNKDSWKGYPADMLKNRARKALWDKFPDALKGLSLREEVEDMLPEPAVVKDVTPAAQGAKILEKLGVLHDTPVIEAKAEETEGPFPQPEMTGELRPTDEQTGLPELGEKPLTFDPETENGARFLEVASEWLADKQAAKDLMAFYLKERMPLTLKQLKAVSVEDLKLLWSALQRNTRVGGPDAGTN